MKMNCMTSSLGLLMLLATFTAGAQTETKPATASNNEIRMMRDNSRTENGKRVERIESEIDDKFYRITLVAEKMTDLYVDGEKVPPAEWKKYDDVLNAIRREMKEQAKRNEEQAVRNAEQAKRNAEQAVRNQEQEKRNAEQAVRNEEQAKKNAEQVVRNKEQEKRNAEQAIRNQAQQKRDEEQAHLNEDQSKRNAEQAVRNKEQEKRNAEQTIRNEEQAKRNAEQARAMEALMKDLSSDLANDKIIKNENDLKQFRFSADGMYVNGVRQPDEVFKRYKQKYSKDKYGILYPDFNYSRDGIIKGE
ncbi:MAG: hypothetical protein JST19_15740 [Bacteroidetes bacterium]|nr:hypothetical protein [Bacteroidota bacterium]